MLQEIVAALVVAHTSGGYDEGSTNLKNLLGNRRRPERDGPQRHTRGGSMRRSGHRQPPQSFVAILFVA
ncbi:MAG: hypothetical protein AAF488_08350, partial [Planctomycetota bacterium]